MAEDTEQLVVQLEARIRDFERNFEKASRTAASNWTAIEKRGKQATDRIQADLSKAASSVGGLLSGVARNFGSAAGIGGLGLSALFATAVKINGELAKLEGLAKRAGLSTDRLQEVKFAANLKGVSDDVFSADISTSLKLLDEAQRQTNSLTKLFNANGLSIRSNNGELIKFDALLERAAKLMAGAKSEAQKAQIADMLGLSREWIRVLSAGPEAFRASAASANDAGAVIDKDMIAKAKAFDRAWDEAIVRFKAGMTSALTDIAGEFAEFWKNVLDSAPGASFISDLLDKWAGGLRGMTLPELENALKRSIEAGVDSYEIDRIQAELDRRLGKKPLRITVTADVSNQPETVIPKERERDAFLRATQDAQKRIALVGAETASIGMLTEARERAKLVTELEEAAKKRNTEAGFQNAAVTEQQRQKINELADAMQAAARRQRLAQEAFTDFNEALKFSGGMVVDFFDKLGDKATSFADLMQSALASLKRAALQAAILGEGPLAGIFGTKSPVSGGTGGILGAFFGGGTTAAVGGSGSGSGGGYAEGGLVSGPGTSRSDSIPARLSNGEFVVRAAATSQHRDLLEAINSGRVARFADGGLVGSMTTPAASMVASTQTVIAPSITVQVTGTPGASEADHAALGDTVAKAVKEQVREVVAAELRTQTRPGGALRR
jgi:hypothetical protein